MFTVGKSCTNHNGREGTCIRVKDCETIKKILTENPISPKVRQFLQKSQCGFKDSFHHVCCADDDNTQEEVIPCATKSPMAVELDWLKELKEKLPQPGQCGRDSQHKIFGGDETEINEWTWSALLQYETRKVKLDWIMK